MRVRKSVPEGYKTGKIASGFPSWMEDNDSNSNHIASSGNTVGHNRPVSAVVPPSAPITAPASSANRELTPFCGIHKIGGYAVQQDDSTSALSSRDSNASSTITTTHAQDAFANRKRIHTEDGSSEEGDGGLFGEDMDWRRRETFPDHTDNQHEVRGPRSLEPMAWCEGGNKTNTMAREERAMAVPKRRGTLNQTTINFGGYAVPQSTGLGVAPVDDFEEAPFLDYTGLSHRGGGRSGDMDMD